MTAAMVEASCRATSRSRSSANSTPCAGQSFREQVARRVVRVPQVIHARQHGAEELAVVDHAADGDAAEADAVIAALAADQAAARALAAHAVVRDRDLERGVHGLRSRVREEHTVEALGRDLDERARELERDRVPHLERRGVIHLRDLLRDRLGDFPAAVAGVDAPQARRGVEHLAAFRGPVVEALGAGEQARVRLELPVRGERHPERIEVERANGAHDN